MVMISKYSIILYIMAEMNEIITFLKKNDKALWKTIGKDINDPTVITNELIRHYQWIFLMGDIDSLDMGDRINKNYKKLFVYSLRENPEFRDEFFNYILFVLKSGFDFDDKSWDRSIIIDILINNKRMFWFDFAAMYTLIASSYSELRPIIMNEFIVDDEIGISKQDFIKLFDGISNQKFFNELKDLIKKERLNTSKNIYLTY